MGRYPRQWYPRRYPRNRAFLAQGKQRVNTKYRICRGAVTAAVTAKQHFWSWVLPRKPAFAGGWLTARLTAKQHFWNLRKPQFPATGFQGVSTESGIFWTGYRAWLRARLQRNRGFLIGTHSPGTQPGTHGKAAFAGAENLPKPYIRCWPGLRARIS